MFDSYAAGTTAYIHSFFARAKRHEDRVDGWVGGRYLLEGRCNVSCGIFETGALYHYWARKDEKGVLASRDGGHGR